MDHKDTDVAEQSEATYKEAESHTEEETLEANNANDPIESNENRDETLTTEEENAAQSEVERIDKAKFDEVQKMAEENYQRFLRAQADLDNFRRRTRQEKEEAAKYASLHLIEQLLPVVDNFERAIVSSQTNRDFDSLVKGLDMIYRQMMQAMEQEGLQVIEAVGQPFDPNFHEAVMQVESEEHGEGIVVEEVQKGYKLKDKVIRPSMVKVSQ